MQPSSSVQFQVGTKLLPETELNGPELDMSIECSVTNANDVKDHTLNFTMLEPRRGAKNLAAGLRLQGLDITVWYKVNILGLTKTVTYSS